MFRFTIRDVLWLTVVVAMGVGWFVHVRSEREARRRESEKQFQDALEFTKEVHDRLSGMGLPDIRKAPPNAAAKSN